MMCILSVSCLYLVSIIPEFCAGFCAAAGGFCAGFCTGFCAIALPSARSARVLQPDCRAALCGDRRQAAFEPPRLKPHDVLVFVCTDGETRPAARVGRASPGEAARRGQAPRTALGA